jgi:rhodanese-related sulfurtransferase
MGASSSTTRPSHLEAALNGARPSQLEIDADAAEAELSTGAAWLLDVREPWEFVRRRVPGANLVPMGQLVGRFDELPAGKRILVICEHGNRSLAVADYLCRRGLDAVSITGGTAAWAGGRKPIEQG